jgi:hypothetical protein
MPQTLLVESAQRTTSIERLPVLDDDERQPERGMVWNGGLSWAG